MRSSFPFVLFDHSAAGRSPSSRQMIRLSLGPKRDKRLPVKLAHQGSDVNRKEPPGTVEALSGRRVHPEGFTLKGMKEDFLACGLDAIAERGEEVLPPTVAMGKQRDVAEKTRIVNSYAKGPARVALHVSKALTWM